MADEARTRYPGYDVLREKDEWDPHTREIVLKRLGPFPARKFLSDEEASFVKLIAGHLVYDERAEILDWVVHSLDTSLAAEIGEGQRKPTAPPAKELVRGGLAAMAHLSKNVFGREFADLTPEEQFSLIAPLQTGKAPPPCLTGAGSPKRSSSRNLRKKWSPPIIRILQSGPR